MPKRLATLAAPLLLLVVLAACGTPNATPTGDTSGGTGGPGSTTPGTPVPAGQKPPRPVPDPADVAAGAPLRAILLAQIEEYAREVAKCNSIGTPVVRCTATGFEAVRPNSPELAAYMSWFSTIRQCSSDGKGGYIATMMFVYSSPQELREPGLLDVYVSGTPWCGYTGSATRVSSFGGRGPAIPRPSTIPAVQGTIQAAAAKSIMADGRPAERATEFTVGEGVYITYTALNVGPDVTIDLKLFRDGAAIILTGTETTFVQAATYYGYYSYKPSQPGTYRAELCFNGENKPAHTVSFTVR